MPRQCCVRGCRSNCRGEKTYTNIFSFPKDAEIRAKWEKQVCREGFIVKRSSVVCIKHFENRFIEREHKATRPDGSILCVPRKNPVLIKDAYPTLFLERPSDPSKKLHLKRKKSDDETRKKLEQEIEEKFQNWCDADKIPDFNELKTNIPNKLPENWCMIPSPNRKSVFFGKPDLSRAPTFMVSVKITTNLIVSVWHNNFLLPKSKLNWLLGPDLKCDLWSKFDCLLNHLDSLNSQSDTDTRLKGILSLFTDTINECKDETSKETLSFLCDQLELGIMCLPDGLPYGIRVTPKVELDP